jgi:hypothetical protein
MGQTIDCLRTEPRDEQAATCVLTKAIRRHGVPETITIDGSAANEAAITRDNEEYGTAIDIRQIKYLHNLVEQDHRGVKRITRPMFWVSLDPATRSQYLHPVIGLDPDDFEVDCQAFPAFMAWAKLTTMTVVNRLSGWDRDHA